MELLFFYQTKRDIREVTRVAYGEKVLSRLLSVGMLVMIVGAALVYLSGRVARRLAPEKQDVANIIIKAVGCVVALIGALMVMGFI